MTPAGHTKDARVFRPSLAGSWFLFAGLLMGPAIILFDRDPQGRKLLWIVMTVFFLGLILHRAGLSYVMDRRALVIRRWWGLLGETVIPYGEISQAEVKRSLAAAVAGRGHVLVATGGGAWEAILSQKDPEALAEELERLRGDASVRGLGFHGDGRDDGNGGDGDGDGEEEEAEGASPSGRSSSAGGAPDEAAPAPDEAGEDYDAGPSLDAADAADRADDSLGPPETGPSLDRDGHGDGGLPPDETPVGPVPDGEPGGQDGPDGGRDGNA
ncbi:MAG: PH domain-containing protein [Deltaproteobacteria bacterium]|jgi:hypothetical protein|nr:PH domain-containing protein [Deltaproteobacteria bacterium]